MELRLYKAMLLMDVVWALNILCRHWRVMTNLFADISVVLCYYFKGLSENWIERLCTVVFHEVKLSNYGCGSINETH